jgi:hypothetical protein
MDRLDRKVQQGRKVQQESREWQVLTVCKDRPDRKDRRVRRDSRE